MIELVDLKASYEADKPEIDEAIARVMASGRYILGPEVDAFEKEFAAWVGARFAVGVANGTDAIALALKAVGCGPGTAVVTVSHTVSATVAAIEQVGATPIMIDVDVPTYTMNVNELREVLAEWGGEPIKAVLPVHIYGQPADLRAIWLLCCQHEVALVDDCAHAFGAHVGAAKVGSFGNASAFSFYPTKNLGCFGDGGMVTTNDCHTAETVRSLRQYGWAQRYVSLRNGGVDSRLDELQAAILRVRLGKLDARQKRRRQIAELYNGSICGRPISVGAEHANHLYVLRHNDRKQFIAHMRRCDIATNIHYPLPVHLQPGYRHVMLGPSGCRVSEQLAREVVSIPLYPEMTDAQAEQVRDALRSYEHA